MDVIKNRTLWDVWLEVWFRAMSVMQVHLKWINMKKFLGKMVPLSAWRFLGLRSAQIDSVLLFHPSNPSNYLFDLQQRAVGSFEYHRPWRDLLSVFSDNTHSSRVHFMPRNCNWWSDFHVVWFILDVVAKQLCGNPRVDWDGRRWFWVEHRAVFMITAADLQYPIYSLQVRLFTKAILGMLDRLEQEVSQEQRISKQNKSIKMNQADPERAKEVKVFSFL